MSAFDITWRDGAYYVSIPNYNGGKVYPAETVEALVKALEYVIGEYDRNVCEHEVTYRGGAIWTICEGCGRKWADDEGGFKPHCDPLGIVEARAALSLAKGEGHGK